MNQCIMKVLFGNQKQALRQNEALANFVEDYLKGSKWCVEPMSTEEVVTRCIKDTLHTLVTRDDEDVFSLADHLFVQYTLGMEAWDAVMAGIPGVIESTYAGDSGKVVFSYIPNAEGAGEANLEIINKAREVSEKNNSSEHVKTLSKGDAAWELIEKIIAMCPPSQRSELPDEDYLAAILLSESYWKAMS